MCTQPLFGQATKQEKNVKIIPQNESQSFMFTNSLGLYYYGETGLANTSPYHGLSFLTRKLIEDYIIEAGGQVLNRSNAEARLYRNKLIRSYTAPEIDEEIALSDSLPVLTVKISSNSRLPISVFPLIFRSNRVQNYTKNWSPSEKILYITHKKQLVQNNKVNYAEWIGISTYPGGEFSEANIGEIIKKNQTVNTKTYLPGKVNLYLEDTVYIFFIIANNKKDILKYREQILKTLNIEMKKKETQIEGIRKA